jgi:hypothetical protein
MKCKKARETGNSAEKNSAGTMDGTGKRDCSTLHAKKARAWFPPGLLHHLQIALFYGNCVTSQAAFLTVGDR